MISETELDKSINKIKFLYRWSGVNLESSKRTRLQNLKITLWYIFNIIWLDFEVAGGIWWLIKHAKHGASFTELFYVTPCLIYFILSNTKSLLFHMHDKQVNEVISILRESEIKCNQEYDAGKKEIVQNETKFLNLILTVLNSYNWCSLIGFVMMPLTYMAIKYYKTNEIELMLPIIAEYPFDQFDIKFYPFVYLRQIWANLVSLFQLASTDFFFYISTSYVRLQFKLLKYDIERNITSPRDDCRNLNQDGELQSNFVNMVKRHQELLYCVHLIEDIYSKSTLFHFSSSSLLICICGFNIMIVDDIPYIISFVCFLIISLYQIFFLCLFGDLLMTSSIEVGEGAYNSKWYSANASVGKQHNVIQIRANVPCKLTAFGFADVNLAAFAKILSSAWSYFALLQRLYGSARG